MSKWDDFIQSVGDLADKTVNKTRELTDTASLKIKIANKEAERDTEYKELGRLAYIKLRKLNGHDFEETTQKISETMDKLDKALQELAELKALDKARKDAKTAEKQAQKEAKAQAKTAEQEPDETLNMDVMNEFNEARETADAEYEKAKKAAEDAK